MISLDEARARVKAAIAGREDYVYPRSLSAGGDGRCVYFEDDGAPSCLVGQAFADELRKVDPANDFNHEGVAELAVGFPDLFDKKTVQYLQLVQDKQDTGWPWKAAVENAEGAVPDIEADQFDLY